MAELLDHNPAIAETLPGDPPGRIVMSDRGVDVETAFAISEQVNVARRNMGAEASLPTKLAISAIHGAFGGKADIA